MRVPRHAVRPRAGPVRLEARYIQPRAPDRRKFSREPLVRDADPDPASAASCTRVGLASDPQSRRVRRPHPHARRPARPTDSGARSSGNRASPRRAKGPRARRSAEPEPSPRGCCHRDLSRSIASRPFDRLARSLDVVSAQRALGSKRTMRISESDANASMMRGLTSFQSSPPSPHPSGGTAIDRIPSSRIFATRSTRPDSTYSSLDVAAKEKKPAERTQRRHRQLDPPRRDVLRTPRHEAVEILSTELGRSHRSSPESVAKECIDLACVVFLRGTPLSRSRYVANARSRQTNSSSMMAGDANEITPVSRIC